jgi:hypothetical protein
MSVRYLLWFGILACFSVSGALGQRASSTTALLVFQGTWLVSRGNTGPAEHLENLCAPVGTFFTCQQKVNGAVAGLLIFAPDSRPGHFYTQTILPGGRATGRDELEISGNRWTFTSSRLDRGKVTYYRNVHTFVTRQQIHFEQAQSTNGKDWTVTATGEQKRTTNLK